MFIHDRIITIIIRLKIERGHMIIKGAYALEEEREEDTATLYKELRKTGHKTNTNDS
jgi:hypothetical protein